MDQIKSPPECIPRRKGGRGGRARRRVPAQSAIGKTPKRGEDDEESNGTPNAIRILEEDSAPERNAVPFSKEGEQGGEQEKDYMWDLRGVAGDASMGEVARDWSDDGALGDKLEGLNGARPSQGQSTPAMYSTPVRPGSVDQEPAPTRSQSRSKLLSVAAAIEAAAAAFAAIPQVREDD